MKTTTRTAKVRMRGPMQRESWLRTCGRIILSMLIKPVGMLFGQYITRNNTNDMFWQTE